MNTEQMRQFLLGRYEGITWREKVKKMSDAQVFAIYKRLQNKKGKDREQQER